ncbi:MAG: NAD-dependent epimerase/dehydratase family protein [Deltaproteobacteria bacterium]|nr:MAG: NAD-dependent epimerase/dehydratase family protein [Deltaproteobacteria bacterium]
MCALGKDWTVVGAGYTGARLARRLVAGGSRVVVTRRERDAARSVAAPLGPAARAVAVDLAEAGGLANAIEPGAVVAMLAPPGPASPEAERRAVAVAAAAGAARIVYVSSTGVYPPSADGAWMDEDTPPAPASERGRLRLAAETAVLDAAAEAGVDAVALRAAGIYGPGRGIAARLAAGTYRIVGDGDTFVCRIHVDDLVSAIVAAGTIARLPRRIYNVCDDEPAPSAVVAAEVARRLGVPPPPRVPVGEVDPTIAAMLTANRRVSNRRLKRELGVALRYPTWREGMAASR